MALVGRAADDQPGPRAGAGDAGIGLAAGITIVARTAVGLGGVGASPARCVADAGVVALILRGPDDRPAAGAHTREAGVGLRASVAVVARGAVRLVPVGAG